MSSGCAQSDQWSRAGGYVADGTRVHRDAAEARGRGEAARAGRHVWVGSWSIGLLTGVGGFSSLGCEPVIFRDLLPNPPLAACALVDGSSPGCHKNAGVRRRYREFSERNPWRTSLDGAERRRDSSEMKPRVPISRREFARRAALASAVVSIVPAAVTAAAAPATSLGGQSAPQDTHPPAPPAAVTQQNPVPGAPKLSVEGQSEADARFQTILVMYGARFSDEQKNDLHRLCAVVQPSLDRIRAYKIENGDGTALYLKPGFEREKKAKVAVPARMEKRRRARTVLGKNRDWSAGTYGVAKFGWMRRSLGCMGGVESKPAPSERLRVRHPSAGLGRGIDGC